MPSAVSQSDTYGTAIADYAIDGDEKTEAHTQCAKNTDFWYKMKFDSVNCFSDVVIINSKYLNDLRYRMSHTKVLVINRETEIENLCGLVGVSDVPTIEGQTYRIPCDLKCGDEVKLTLRHDSSNYTREACIHIYEITTFLTGQ